MDNIERAIRGALDKGNADERAFREKVYRSAFAALERTLQANESLSEDDRLRRRAALKATIKNVETDYLPALPPEPAAPPPKPEPVADVPEPDEEPRRAELSFPAPPEPEPWDEAEVGPAAERDDLRVREAARRSRFWPLLAVLVILALIAAAAISATRSGIFGADDVVPAPQDQVEEPQEEGTLAPPLRERPAEPVQEAAAADDWVSVFTPNDLSLVSTRGGATAELMEADGQPFLRLRSGGAGAAAEFEVGEGILERLAGRSAVFSFVAGAPEEEGETQISVECALGALGDCGRRRFLVGINRDEFLFELALPDANPGGGGAISIKSDIEQQGRAVDIFSIRVAPAE